MGLLYLFTGGKHVTTVNILCVVSQHYTSARKVYNMSNSIINPLNAELNPICYFWHYYELTIFSTLAG